MNSSKSQNNNASSYKVIKLLGEGSYGKAYLVQRNSDQLHCVIKTIHIEQMSEQEQKETQEEAKILERMDHSNIIQILEFFVSKSIKNGKTFNIVTEYADGGDLGQKIKSQPKTKPFPENIILDYFTQICLAIKHIHSKHIIHRDLKAQNIFLTKNGLVKMGDFGIAKRFEFTWQKAMTMIGTPYYLSPEIVEGKGYSYKSDIWSLGVLLYEMMALKMPFDANSLPMLSLKIMKGAYSPCPNSYSKDLKDLVGRLLNVDPNKRLSAAEILNLPFIKSRIKIFLSEVDYNKEFSTTFVKTYKTNIQQQKQQIGKPVVINSPIGNIGSSDNNKINVTPLNIDSFKKNKQEVQPPINYHIQRQQQQQEFHQQQQQQKQLYPQQQSYHQIQSQQQLLYQQQQQHQIQSQQQQQYNQIPKRFEERTTEQYNKRPNNNNLTKCTNPNYDYDTSSTNVTSNINNNEKKSEIERFLRNKRELKLNQANKSNNNFEVYWPTKSSNPQKSSSEEMISKVQKIKLTDKQDSKTKLAQGCLPIEEDPREQEEEYKVNCFLNHLNNIINEKEDSDNEGTEEEQKTNELSINDVNTQREQEEVQLDTEQQSSNQSQSKNINNQNDISEYTEIEEMRIVLENSLGIELFKPLYHYVDSTVDPNVYKCDIDKIKEHLKLDLTEKNFSQVDIDRAIEKIPEVFSIVVKDRDFC